MLSEPIFGLYLMLGIGLTLRSFVSRSLGAKSILKDVAAGVFWGMAVLTRPFILAAVPLGWILALWRPGHRRTRAGMLLIQTLAMLAVVMPWVIRNHRVMGRATLVTLAPSLAFFGAHHEDTLNDPKRIGYWRRIRLDDPRYPLSGTELEMAATCWRYGMDSIRKHADQMPKLVLYKLWRLITPFAYEVPPLRWLLAVAWLTTAPFVLVGPWMVAQRAPALATALLLPVLVTTAAVVVVHGAPRFRHALAPCFLIFAATALVELARRVGQRFAYLHNRLQLRHRPLR